MVTSGCGACIVVGVRYPGSGGLSPVAQAGREAVRLEAAAVCPAAAVRVTETD